MPTIEFSGAVGAELSKRMSKLTIIKNAAANVIRGMATAIVAVALPPFLTRSLSLQAYGAWALVLQLTAYISYLDFGLQTAVGRFVAHANERKDSDHRDRIVSTATIALIGASILASVSALVIAILIPRLFHGMSASMFRQFRVALVVVGLSVAIGLPISVFNGIFVGLQRYEIPALITGGTRFLGAALVVIVARSGGSLGAMAWSLALVNLASYALVFLFFRRFAGNVRIERRFVDRHTSRELFSYCYALAIWTFAMLLISGLDLTIVGIFDFRFVPYFAVAASLVTFVSGLQNAIFTALIPAAAVLHARQQNVALGRMLIDSTRYGSFLLLATGVPLLLWGKPILQLWVGPLYAQNARSLLVVLVIANIIRLSATPYAVALVGVGQQRLLTISPLVEGITNVCLSILGCYLFGAIGVAFGTLAGAIIAVLVNLFYNMRRTTEISFSRREYVREALIRPCLCVLPLLAVFALSWYFPADVARNYQLIAVTMAWILTLLLVWSYGMAQSERKWIKLHILRRVEL